MAKHTRPQTTLSGLIPPDQMFGRVLPGRFIIDAAMPFEERVERAWQHIKATRFTEDEYERLQEAIVELVTSEASKS